MQCPCHSGKKYAACCEPFHQGILPPTALDLMRSRYSAYALSKIDYIIETSHPKHRDLLLPRAILKAKINNFCSTTTFKGLSIIDKELSEPFSTVTFRAELIQNEQDASYTEKSLFEKIQGRWLYLSGQIL